jgi:hypothetical protein
VDLDDAAFVYDRPPVAQEMPAPRKAASGAG